MIRLYVPHDLSAGGAIALDPDQSRYLASVMRRGAGDEVAVFNGRDGEWRGVISEVGKRVVTLRLADQARAQETTPDLELAVAVVKRGRLETIVEKAAELGARKVQLVVTERTNADHARLPRLTAIATEAAEQTGRLDVPEIGEAVKLSDYVARFPAGRRLLFCDEGGEAQPALKALAGQTARAWSVLIGPEGGFSPTERERLRGLSFATPATLGPRILRADTASIAALSLWQAALGDWRD